MLKSKEKFVFLFIFYQKCQRPQLKSKVKHSLTILMYKTKSHHTSMQLSITGVFGFTNLIEKQKHQKWRITKYIKLSIYLCMIWFHVSFRTIHFWQNCGTWSHLKIKNVNYILIPLCLRLLSIWSFMLYYYYYYF